MICQINLQTKKDPTLNYSKNQFIRQNRLQTKKTIFKKKFHKPIGPSKIQINHKKIETNKKSSKKTQELMWVEDKLVAKFKEKVKIHTLFEYNFSFYLLILVLKYLKIINIFS